MSRISYNDLKLIETQYINTNNYRIDRNLYFNTMEEAYKEMIRIYNNMRNKIFKNKKTKGKYIDIIFYIGISQTDGNTAIKTKEKTKGRPKYIVKGKKKKPHIHIAVYGKNASSFCSEIIKVLNRHNNKEIFTRLRKRFKNKGNLLLYKQEKLTGVHNGFDYIPYIFEQSDSVVSNTIKGDINLTELYDKMYIIKDKTFT